MQDIIFRSCIRLKIILKDFIYQQIKAGWQEIMLISNTLYNSTV